MKLPLSIAAALSTISVRHFLFCCNLFNYLHTYLILFFSNDFSQRLVLWCQCCWRRHRPQLHSSPTQHSLQFRRTFFSCLYLCCLVYFDLPVTCICSCRSNFFVCLCVCAVRLRMRCTPWPHTRHGHPALAGMSLWQLYRRYAVHECYTTGAQLNDESLFTLVIW